MKKRTSHFGLIAAAIVAGGGLIAMNQSAQNASSAVAEWRAAAVDVIRWGENPDGLAKFDTRTGSISIFNANPRRAGTTPQWVEEIDGVGSGPVGTFRLDATDTPAIFLVNVVTGETWVARRRQYTESGPQYGQWERIRDHRSSIRATGS